MRVRHAVFLVLLVITLALFGTFFSLRAAWSDTAAEQFGESYARIAVYYPDSLPLTLEGVNTVRTSVDSRLAQDSHSSEGRLWYDLYYGCDSVSVSSALDPTLSFSSDRICVGGDWFKTFELEFLSGGPFLADDNYSDRVVLDARASFRLFGSYNSVDMPIYVNGEPFFVAGVVKTPEDKAWNAQFSDRPVVIFPEEKAVGTVFSSYEIVLPDPVNGYAKSVVEASVPESCAVVDVSARYSFSSLWENLCSFSTRSFVTEPITYPFCENLSRAREDILALLLIPSALSALSLIAASLFIVSRRKK